MVRFLMQQSLLLGHFGPVYLLQVMMVKNVASKINLALEKCPLIKSDTEMAAHIFCKPFLALNSVISVLSFG